MADFWSYMGAPIVSGASSIFGGLLSGIFGSGASKRQIEAAKEMNRENIRLGRETNAQQMDMFNRSLDFNAGQSDLSWQRQKEMFDMENLYNSPLEIVKRLNEAGINPQVAFNGMTGFATSADGATPSGGASAPGIPSLTPPQYKFMPDYQSFNPFEAIANGVGKFALAAKSLADARKAGIDTEFAERALEDNLKIIASDAKYKQVYATLYEEFEPKRLSKELYKLDKETRKIDEEIDNLVKEGNYILAKKRLEDLLGDKQVFENNYLSAYYKRKEFYLDRFVKAELDTSENNAKAIIMNALSNQTSAKAAYNSSLAALKNANTQEYLAHNPNDLAGLLANVIKGYAGSPEEFGKMIKKEGILGVIYKMTKGERDKTFQVLADEIKIPYRYLKRYIKENDPLGGFLDWIQEDGNKAERTFGFKPAGYYLIDYLHKGYDDFRDDEE